MGVKNTELFDTAHTMAAPLFFKYDHPWEILSEIKNFILLAGERLGEDYELNEREEPDEQHCQTYPAVAFLEAEPRHTADGCAYLYAGYWHALHQVEKPGEG